MGSHPLVGMPELFDLYQSMMRLSMGGLYNMEQKQDYLDKMTRIVELQKVMYFRAKYSAEEDDAFEFIQHMKQCLESWDTMVM